MKGKEILVLLLTILAFLPISGTNAEFIDDKTNENNFILSEAEYNNNLFIAYLSGEYCENYGDSYYHGVIKIKNSNNNKTTTITNKGNFSSVKLIEYNNKLYCFWIGIINNGSLFLWSWNKNNTDYEMINSIFIEKELDRILYNSFNYIVSDNRINIFHVQIEGQSSRGPSYYLYNTTFGNNVYQHSTRSRLPSDSYLFDSYLKLESIDMDDFQSLTIHDQYYSAIRYSDYTDSNITVLFNSFRQAFFQDDLKNGVYNINTKDFKFFSVNHSLYLLYSDFHGNINLTTYNTLTNKGENRTIYSTFQKNIEDITVTQNDEYIQIFWQENDGGVVSIRTLNYSIENNNWDTEYQIFSSGNQAKISSLHAISYYNSSKKELKTHLLFSISTPATSQLFRINMITLNDANYRPKYLFEFAINISNSIYFFPGETKQIVLKLTNVGKNSNDILIDVNLSNQLWYTQKNSIVHLKTYEEISITLNVSAPTELFTDQEKDTFWYITLSSEYNLNNIYYHSSFFKLNIISNLSITPDIRNINTSETSISEITKITNTGNIGQNFTLELIEEDPEWNIVFPNDVFLYTNDFTQIHINFTILNESKDEQYFNTSIRIKSALDHTVFKDYKVSIHYLNLTSTIEIINIPDQICYINKKYSITPQIIGEDIQNITAAIESNFTKVEFDADSKIILVSPVDGDEGSYYINFTIYYNTIPLDFSNFSIIVIDKIAPETPTGLIIDNISHNNVRIMWDDGKAPDIMGYLIFINNSQIDKVKNVQHYQLSNLDYNITYSFQIMAYDEVPNYSDLSDELLINIIPLFQEDNDIDGDGISDNIDIFPEDPSEWNDTDNDGMGDNSDAFPNDPSASIDTDNDGLPDSWNPGKNQNDSTSDPPLELDPYPNDPDNIPPDNDGNETPANGKSKTWIWASGIAAVVIVVAVAVVLLFHKKKEPPEDQDDHGGVEAKPNEERNK